MPFIRRLLFSRRRAWTVRYRDGSYSLIRMTRPNAEAIAHAWNGHVEWAGVSIPNPFFHIS
jgi:hypothetical protein